MGERSKRHIIYKLFLSLMIFGTLIGCGQERNHKPLPKIEVFSKSLIDTSKEYLYVPSTDQVSRTTRIGRPYFQGDEKIVKFKFEKNYLVAYAQEKDQRFEDNETNSKPVFRIPISHVDYREMKDPFGEGTNIEEKNEYIEWDKRKYFEPKPEAFEFSDVSTLPAELEQIFGSTCSRKVGQAELEFNVTQEQVDIVIKRDFYSNIFCVGDFSELSDLAWSEITHHSLVPLDLLVSKDYETIIYDRDWERTFGFFDTLDVKVDSANNTTQVQEIYYMNRWNPKRHIIQYYLDPRFEKPENKAIKQATFLGFERLNAALEKADVNFRLHLVEGPEDMRPGDLTKSSIVLVEDPLAVGLLGYGPSVANPRTGEIVQARTVMYPGIMKKLVRRAYDELHEQEKIQRGTTKVVRSQLSPEKEALLQAMDRNMALKKQVVKNQVWNQHKGELAHKDNLSELLSHSHETSPSLSSELLMDTLTVDRPSRSVSEVIRLGAKAFFNDTEFSLRSIFKGFQAAQNSEEFDLDHLDIIEALSKHNMTPARVEAFADIKDGDLKDQILALGKGRVWHELDEDTRAQIVDLVLPYVWIPTLIHEVGHNLGLRHNFAGSEDKNNFYTKDELHSLGVSTDLGSPYASMMEYSKSEITGLRVPGKYDIAALRYGYLQKVELEDGSIVSVTAKPNELTLKSFEYCSDEGVALNPNCNRFDEGSGYVEIAKSLIDSYHEYYRLRNFRNGEAHFSMIDDIMYASRVNQQFRSLRLMLERFTDIVIDFNLQMSDVASVDWLQEMNEGAKLGAEFLMSVVSEADYSCVVFNNTQFAGVVTFASLAGKYSDAKTCYDVPLNAGYQVVGEIGRRYNHQRFRDNPNIYQDQIDVRGVWMDKLLAYRYLVARNLNEYSFDDYTLSYVDHPEIGQEVNNFVKNLILGNVISNTEITFKDGTKTDFEHVHNFSEGYEIKKPLLPFVHRSLRLPYDQLDLTEAMMFITRNQLHAGLESIPNQKLRESLLVSAALPQDGRDPALFTTYKLGQYNYVAAPENEVALSIFDKLRKKEIYDSQTRDRLLEILGLIEQEQPLPANASVIEQEIYKGGLDDLYMYLIGEYPSEEYYNRVLHSMINR